MYVLEGYISIHITKSILVIFYYIEYTILSTNSYVKLYRVKRFMYSYNKRSINIEYKYTIFSIIII